MTYSPTCPDPDSEDIAERIADMLGDEGDVASTGEIVYDENTGGHHFEMHLRDGKGRFRVQVIPPEGGSVL